MNVNLNCTLRNPCSILAPLTVCSLSVYLYQAQQDGGTCTWLGNLFTSWTASRQEKIENVQGLVGQLPASPALDFSNGKRGYVIKIIPLKIHGRCNFNRTRAPIHSYYTACIGGDANRAGCSSRLWYPITRSRSPITIDSESVETRSGNRKRAQPIVVDTRRDLFRVFSQREKDEGGRRDGIEPESATVRP